MIYLSYFLGNLAILRARARGWPKASAPFRLGRWGLVVNVIGLLYGGAMLINFAWPRVASNPKPKQTGGLLSFRLGFLNGIPILWTVAIFIALIGALYYLIIGRTKEFAPVTAPSPDDDLPAVAGAGRRTAAPTAGTDPVMPPPPGSGRRSARPALRTSARQPPKIVRGPGTTAHAQIEDWLADEIAVGALVPGDRLPTEHDLAAWLGVSRMTLRHALGELAQRGLVTRTVGRHGGTFVAAPKLEQDLTTLAGFSEQLRRHGMVAGARVLAASQRPAGPAAAAALELGRGRPGARGQADPARRRQADRDRALAVPGRPVPRHAGLPARRLALRAARGQVRAAAAPGQGVPGAGRRRRARGRGAGGRRKARR